MHISILNPPYHVGKKHFESPFIPLGLAHLKAFLRQRGIPCTIDDLHVRIMHRNQERIVYDLREYDSGATMKLSERILQLTRIPDQAIVCFSLFNACQIRPMIGLAKALKKRRLAGIVVGGPAAAPSLLDHPSIDFVVIGDGALPLLRLSQALQKNSPLSAVPRLAYKHENTICLSDEYHGNDNYSGIAVMPCPDFSGLPLEIYTEIRDPSIPLPRTKPILPYSFLEGCTGSCFFCAPEKRGFSSRPRSTVKADLLKLRDTYHTNYFFFLNNSINADKGYLTQLMYDIQGLGLIWSDCARLEGLDFQSLSAMRNSGCVKLCWGMESASETMLERMNKGITVNQARKILTDSDSAGIWNEVNFIIGYPHETEEEFCQSLRFIKENSDIIDTVNCAPFFLKPTTLMMKHPERFGISIRKNTKDPYHQCPGFDEIGGLSWEERIRTTSNRVRRFNEELGGKISRHRTSALYYYYELRKKKRLVRRMMDKLLVP